jgi:hypothetical protein
VLAGCICSKFGLIFVLRWALADVTISFITHPAGLKHVSCQLAKLLGIKVLLQGVAIVVQLNAPQWRSATGPCRKMGQKRPAR